MDQLIKAKIDATSNHLCSKKLLRLAIVITFAITLLCAIAFGTMGLEKMAWIDLYTALISALCLVYFTLSNQIKPTAWVLATAIYLCLTVQIYQFSEYLIELGMSFTFVVIVMAASGAFAASVIWLGIVLTTISLLSPHSSSSHIFDGFFYAFTQMDVFSLSAIIIGFSLGGIFFTHQSFHMHRKVYAASCLDNITQLPNRVMLEKRLETYFALYKKDQKYFHILFVDAEHFNKINDLFGHDVGDDVLRQMGRRLQQACIELLNSDVEVFRFGDDEFVITIPDHLPAEQLQKLAIDLQHKVGSDYKVGDYELNIGLIMGMSTSGKSAKSAKDLIRFADIAMYSAKKSGAKHAAYQESEVSDWDRHFIIHQSLSKALEKHELRAVVQPVYESPSLRLMGGEVLIRWNSSELGPVPTDEVIAVAEASGLITHIGQFIFDQSLEMIKQLKSTTDKDLKIAVNVSPYQLKNKCFYEYVAKKLSGKPSLSASLELEITESSAFVNSQHATQALLKFKEMGLSVALDDYGTGATSFMSLQQGAFTRLKLDKSLLDDAMLDDKKYLVIKAAVDSAHSLGLEVTAEGVEVSAQYELIKQLGCTAVQGYLFSRPLELDDFITLFQEQEFFSHTPPRSSGLSP